MRIQSVISTKVELSVPPENENEVQATNVLTSDDHAYLKRLWAKFHNRIQKLDENDTYQYILLFSSSLLRSEGVSFSSNP